MDAIPPLLCTGAIRKTPRMVGPPTGPGKTGYSMTTPAPSGEGANQLTPGKLSTLFKVNCTTLEPPNYKPDVRDGCDGPPPSPLVTTEGCERTIPGTQDSEEDLLPSRTQDNPTPAMDRGTRVDGKDCVHTAGGVCNIHGEGARLTWKVVVKKTIGPGGRVIRKKDGRKYFYVCDIGPRGHAMKQTRISFGRQPQAEDDPSLSNTNGLGGRFGDSSKMNVGVRTPTGGR